ncbi:Methyltransferase domain-containing protein [Geodermatophilus telluris]|uniref:Methyltransferase domain-containing protein n=1 Tax=Geodermatophilus telluris TaxID=1190417 RepID=A0A1G6L5T6_9ACTN|nr:methyltransferase domain-containing protein [Geodermatophilus telluris]SDC38537.1 Methyltransferase domain-containing protein [Geodermatophilus telluris]
MRTDILVCPTSKQPLREVPLEVAERDLPRGSAFQAPLLTGCQPVGRTPTVWLRADGRGAYPVEDGFPVLRAPEMLTPSDQERVVDVTVEPYSEVYSELLHYSGMGRADAASIDSSTALRDMRRLTDLAESGRVAFPDPPGTWLDAKYELGAQYDAFRHLRPLRGARVLQLGGSGLHAVRFLLAGAEEAWLASPMTGELLFGTALAARCGVADRLHSVAGLAEELPFADNSFDAIYSQGCVHHWVVPLAGPECLRVLRSGGRFAAVEPWRGPLYGIGTKLLGKRDRNVECVVLTAGRVAVPFGGLDALTVVHHGALTRYVLLALTRAGLKFDRRVVWRIGRIDDAISSAIPHLRDTGSSVAILGVRPGVARTDAAGDMTHQMSIS